MSWHDPDKEDTTIYKVVVKHLDRDFCNLDESRKLIDP